MAIGQQSRKSQIIQKNITLLMISKSSSYNFEEPKTANLKLY